MEEKLGISVAVIKEAYQHVWQHQAHGALSYLEFLMDYYGVSRKDVWEKGSLTANTGKPTRDQFPTHRSAEEYFSRPLMDGACFSFYRSVDDRDHQAILLSFGVIIDSTAGQPIVVFPGMADFIVQKGENYTRDFENRYTKWYFNKRNFPMRRSSFLNPSLSSDGGICDSLYRD